MRRRLAFVFSILTFFGLGHCRSLGLPVTHKCDLESDQIQIGRCLRGYLDLWELVRSYESHAIDILFPVPFYNRNSVLFLCDAYLTSRTHCLQEGVLKKCDSELITFVQSHMQYFCGEKAPLALEEFTCISRSLRNQTKCHSHVRGVPHNHPGKCTEIPKFLDCVEEELRAECGDRGFAVVVDALRTFGCAVSEDRAKEAAKIVAKFNATGALTEAVAKEYIEREKPSKLPDELRVLEAAQTMEIVVGGPPPDPNSLSEVVRRYFERKNANVRRAPQGRTPVDEIEKNAFLETDPSVEIAFSEDDAAQTHVNAPEENFVPKEEKCDNKKRAQLAQCYAPLIRRWDEIDAKSQKSKAVLLPIYNFSLAHISELCEVFQVTLEECLTPNLLDSCHDNEMIEFVDEQLGNVCSHQTNKKFSTEFLCAREAMISSPHCFELILGRHEPGMNKEEKCAGMNAFYECLEGQVASTCPSESLKVLQTTIHGFGCPLKTSNADTSSNSVASSETKTTETTSAPPSTKSPEPRNHSSDAEILEGGLFSYRLSPECTKPMQTKARQCVAPLMRTWISLREQRPVLSELTFPVYKYTRTELLELCDAYANVFLCAGFEPIMRCLNDELVRFARDHLGYQCSPQNIERFMKHYDCIMELEVVDAGDCRKFVLGLAEPGKDQRKCRGVRQYHDCMKPQIAAKCEKGAAEEFEQTISEFGCEF